MKRMIAVILVLISCVSCACLMGCLGPKSLDEYGYAMAIGFDKGAQRKYNVSFYMQREGSSSESGSSSVGINTLSAEGDTIFEAMTVLHTSLSFQLDLSRVNYVIVSADIAKEEGLEPIYSTSMNLLKMRQSAKLLIAVDSAKEFMENAVSQDNPNAVKVQFNLLKNTQLESTAPSCNYALFFESVTTSLGDALVPLGHIDKSIEKKDEPAENTADTTFGHKRTGGMPSYIAGTAVFSGWKMVGALSPEDTRFAMLGRGDFKTGHFLVDYDGGMLSLAAKLNGARKCSIDISANRAFIHLNITCDVEYDGPGYASGVWSDYLKGQVEEYMVRELTRVYTLMRQMGADGIALGREAVRHFTSVANWESFDTASLFASTECVFSVDMKLNDMNIDVISE